MKRIFIGITYLVSLVVTLVYMEISGFNGVNSIMGLTSNTGLPIIGLILSIPAFIFTIISLSIQNKTIALIRDLLSAFAMFFNLAASVVSLFKGGGNSLFAQIIVFIFGLFVFVLSIVGIVKAIITESDKSKN